MSGGHGPLWELAGQVQQRLQAGKAEVAHLKMTLTPDSGQLDLAVVHLMRNDFLPELSVALTHPVRGGAVDCQLESGSSSRGTWVGGA